MNRMITENTQSERNRASAATVRATLVRPSRWSLVPHVFTALLYLNTPHASAQLTNPFEGAQLVNPFEGLSKSIRSAFTSLTNPKFAEVMTLVDSNSFDEANKLYEANVDAFKELPTDQLLRLAPLAKYLNERALPSVETALEKARLLLSQDPASMLSADWGSVKSFFVASDQATSSYDRHKLLLVTQFRAQERNALAQVQVQLRSNWERYAPTAFDSYDHFGGMRFDVAYPVDVDMKTLVTRLPRVSDWTRGRTRTEIDAVALAIGESLSQTQRQELAEARLSVAVSASSTLLERVAAVQSMRSGVLPGAAPKLAGFQIYMLSSNRPQEVNISWAGDLGRHVEATDLGKLVSLPDDRMMILVDPTGSKVERKVLERKEVTSQYVSGTRREANPEYTTALLKYRDAENALNRFNANLQNASSPLAAVLQGVAGIALAAAKNNAFNELNTTPQYVNHDVRQDYKYVMTRVQSIKRLKIRVLAYDPVSGATSEDVVERSDSNTFTLTYGVHERDPNASGLRAGSEADIDAFERTAVEVSVYDVLASVSQQRGKVVPARVVRELVAHLEQKAMPEAAPIATGLAATVVTKPDSSAPEYVSTSTRSSTAATPEGRDARFESVVVIQTPNGGLGSGFYVSNDLVVTNQHVVDGAGFAEVVLSSGRKSFAKVVKTDVNLDLAVLRVADPGTPVAFYSGQVNVGATVDVIGHPKGLSYSLTRGVVSGVRRMKNPMVRGGGDVTIIQTDATINPGNSGGPMFVGDKVIGVSTRKRTGEGIEGLGFGVHYAEVIKFLQD